MKPNISQLRTVDGETLMSQPLRPPDFVVSGLLSKGLHILAGSPKVGKSWLALWLAVTVAKGEPVWGMNTQQGITLYLCLEDSTLRIQNRLFEITEDAPSNVHFTTQSDILGKGLEEQINFAGLLHQVNAIPGDFRIRFMTSHPKDCTRELLDAMADCEKVAKHLHLPFQSGNDRVLKEMNRRYTREQYLELIRYARQVMPELSLTSDVIVGFPGETYEAFQDTLSLVEEVGFTSLFTFIFSPREGTPAAKMPDPVSREEKGRWFRELTDLQERVASARNQKLLGKRFRVLVEGPGKKAGLLAGRTEGNLVIEFPGGDSLIGEFVEVVVTEALAWILRGQMEI